MNKIVNGVANDYEFPFLEKTTENYYQVMNRYYTEEFVKQLQQELQRKDNIINVIKEELSRDFYTYVCKNKSYGKTFKAGAEVYKQHLLYKIKELENENNT